jgi:hypothetical protein
LAEYTTELLNVLNVLGLLVKLEPKQADLLTRICATQTIPESTLKATMAAPGVAPPARKRAKRREPRQGELPE